MKRKPKDIQDRIHDTGVAFWKFITYWPQYVWAILVVEAVANFIEGKTFLGLIYSASAIFGLLYIYVFARRI